MMFQGSPHPSEFTYSYQKLAFGKGMEVVESGYKQVVTRKVWQIKW